MYGTGGKVVGPAAVGGAGAGLAVGDGGLARTGGPLVVLTVLALVLLVAGFVLVRARLRATEDQA